MTVYLCFDSTVLLVSGRGVVGLGLPGAAGLGFGVVELGGASAFTLSSISSSAGLIGTQDLCIGSSMHLTATADDRLPRCSINGK